MKKLLLLLIIPLLSFGQTTQNISLSTGWSIFSTYIVPENTNIEDVFANIIDDVIIVKDKSGNVYWPEFNLNSIGDIQIGDAYQIKMENEKELIIDGVVSNCDTEIELNSGWNLIGYLNQLSTPIDEQFNSISEALIIIKDDVGNVYWPTYSINTIINLNPGEGYKIKVNSDISFNYTCNEECISYNYDCDGGAWQPEVTWEIQNENAETLLSGGAPESGEICLTNGCYTIIVTDSYGDGWNGNILNIGGLTFSNEDLDACSNCGEESQTFELCVPMIIIEGCTDFDADNYNETANLDDGSCTYPVSNSNMELVAIYDYDETINDIWGYADGSNEYALVGTNEGFSLVDISIPESPTEVFFIEGDETIWRDIKTWQNYAYVVCDNCNNGLLIVDLNDLTGQTYSFITNFFDKAHNIFIDENGFLYAFGGSQGSDTAPYGVMILNLNNDPMNPTLEGSFDDLYLHDGMVRDNMLWGAAIYEGVFIVINVSDKSNPYIMSSYPTSCNFTHNAWISDDGNTLFTTDEQAGCYIGAYDVSDIYNIEILDQIQSWSGLGNVVPHNTHVAGNYLVTSYYTDGVTIVDASDPYNLVEVGHYDTSPQYEGSGYNGCWGAYPYLPSGLILATDRENGLHILSTTLELIND